MVGVLVHDAHRDAEACPGCVAASATSDDERSDYEADADDEEHNRATRRASSAVGIGRFYCLGVPAPLEDIDSVREAHQRLHRTMHHLDVETVRRPSLLPGWSVGHVLTHLARNADSVVRRLEGAERGVQVEQYAGGQLGRAREIELGAQRSTRAIVDDLVQADRRLDAALVAASDEVWDQEVAAGGGGLVTASRLAFARWREVEIHHVDLGLGYRSDDWPERLVTAMLGRALAGLPARADPRHLLAWTLGRASAPELTPWG
jgi:maleylpyruvate isomerase